MEQCAVQINDKRGNTHTNAYKIYYFIPFPENNCTFQLRESCRNSTIASALVLDNTRALAIVEPRGFDAAEMQVIYDIWYYTERT